MIALCVLLAAACVYDYKRRRIPNYLTAMMIFFGLGWRFRLEGGGGVLAFSAGTALMTALMYLFFRIGAVGAGDVKLLGATAGFLPFEKIIFFLFFSLLIGAIFSIVKILKQKYAKERIRYLLEYLADTAKSGRWKLYMEDERERHRTGVCLSGPIFFSLLLYLGGVY